MTWVLTGMRRIFLAVGYALMLPFLPLLVLWECVEFGVWPWSALWLFLENFWDSWVDAGQRW